MQSTKLGGGKAYLITSPKLQKGILNQLSNRWSVEPFALSFKREHEILRRSNLKALRRAEYLIHPNTIGTKYLIYLTVYNGKKYVLFIAPKHEKIFAAKNLFPPKDDTTASLFADTLIKAEIVKSRTTSEWFLITNDIISKFGDNLTTLPYTERLKQLFKLDKFFKDRFDGLTYQVNTVTDCASLEYLINKTFPTLSYPLGGVIFVPKFPKHTGRSLLFNVERTAEEPQTSLSKFMTSASTTSSDFPDIEIKPVRAVFEVNMTPKSDVYQLYYHDKAKRLVYYGLGYISDIEHSKKLIEVFRKVTPAPIKDNPELYELKTSMLCEYKREFGKWMPLKQTDEQVCTSKDIEEQIAK